MQIFFLKVSGLFVFVLYVALEKRISSKIQSCLVLSDQKAFFFNPCVFLDHSNTVSLDSPTLPNSDMHLTQVRNQIPVSNSSFVSFHSTALYN